MNSEHWERVQTLLEQALEQPEAVRREFVASACGADTALRDEVISLLEAPAVDQLPTAWLDALANPEPARFVPGQRVADRYVVQALLGRGGMGDVYEALDEELAITVALKTLRLAEDGDAGLQRLKLEGMLARAVWHPNVCRVYDLGRHGEASRAVWFLTMERLHGATLAELLRDASRLPLARVLRLAEQMAAGLGAAHQAGVVHRDFKPGNVMLVGSDGAEQAVVTDFGTARAAAHDRPADSEATSGLVIGTPAYMAPEQVRGEEAGPAADIYALGVVLFEMVTGTLPFTGDSALEIARRRLQADAPPPRSVVPDLEEHWDAVIRRCLAREPRHRFGRAEDVADALAGRRPAEELEVVDRTSRVRHTLPAERDPFVGRELEIEALEQSLSEARLVTLLGAGGMGKTRLAVHFGRRSLATWPGGVCFCDLTEARTPGDIASAVARALGVLIGRGNPFDQVGQAIAARGQCLLILDNFEQVVGQAGETVGRWLEQAAEARCLVTSRIRLDLDLERVQPVEPLPTEVGTALFEARARGLRPALELAGDEAEAAREIVRLVDGMPLAIELAAARVRVMSAARIATQMRNRFQLLTGGRGERHQTLEAAIDGSWELLTPWERAAWMQCAVFEGGFTLGAAEAVLNLRAWPEAPWVVDVIRLLVDKSLLRSWAAPAAPGEALPPARFGMYVTLQEYARMKLRRTEAAGAERSASGLERATQERHARWFARYGTVEAIVALDQHGGTKRRRELDRELDNLMTACRRAKEFGNGEIAAALYLAAVEVLLVRGPYGAGVQLGRDLLSDLHLEHQPLADVLRTLGTVERLSGQMDDARSHWDAALDVAREDGARRTEGIVLGSLGILHIEQRRMEEARAHFEAAVAIQREQGDRHSEGVFAGYLGVLDVSQSRMEEGCARLEAALVIHREEGNRRHEGFALASLVALYRDQGRIEEAMRSSTLLLAIHREADDRRSEGLALLYMGDAKKAGGNPDDARAHYQAALAIFREIGARRPEGISLAYLGDVLRKLDRLEDARVHLEAGLAILRETGDRLYEGIALATLGDVLLEQGRLDEAGASLEDAERILRQLEARVEVGKLLCTRAERERRLGNHAEAATRVEEARVIRDAVGAGPESDLARMVATARRSLGVEV